MIGNVLQFQDLQALCRPKATNPPRRATVEAWARKIGLRYTYDGKGGIISTLEAVNAAIGVTASNDDGKYRPEDIVG